MVYWVFIFAGLYLVVRGIVSKGRFINESEFQSTTEERQSAKATPLKRILVAAVGTTALVYGIIHLWHQA